MDAERIIGNICKALTVLDPTGIYTFREMTKEEKEKWRETEKTENRKHG